MYFRLMLESDVLSQCQSQISTQTSYNNEEDLLLGINKMTLSEIKKLQEVSIITNTTSILTIATIILITHFTIYYNYDFFFSQMFQHLLTFNTM